MTYWDTRAGQVGGRVAVFDGIPWDTGTADMAVAVADRLTGSGPFLDVGCGVGRLTDAVAGMTGEEAFGVDGSPAMLAEACGVRAAAGDVGSLPFPTATFGGAWSVLVAQHLTAGQVEAMFGETARVTREGGRFVVQYVPGTTHDGPDQRHTPGEMRGYAEPAGWTLTGVASGLVHPDWMWDTWQR